MLGNWKYILQMHVKWWESLTANCLRCIFSHPTCRFMAHLKRNVQSCKTARKWNSMCWSLNRERLEAANKRCHEEACSFSKCNIAKNDSIKRSAIFSNVWWLLEAVWTSSLTRELSRDEDTFFNKKWEIISPLLISSIFLCVSICASFAN